MRERRVTRDAPRPAHWEYTYRVPLFGELSPFPVSRQTEYTDAVINGGWVAQDTLKMSTRMDFMVREREEKIESHRGILEAHHVQVWLLANQYTASKRDLMIEQFTLEHLPSLSYFDTIKERVEAIILAECGTT